MMPSLIGSADDNPFPPTAKYLFVGGPKHGQHLEVIENDPTFKVMAPPSPAFSLEESPLSDSGPYEVHTYLRREIGMQDKSGQRYVRAVYVHEVIPSAEVAQQLLMAALLADFVKGGRKVIEADVSGRGSDSGR